jgi:molecular chaperone Hsp33
MKQEDGCKRFIFAGLDMRGEVVRLDESFTRILANKDYPPAVRSLLGEFLAASVLLTTTVKFDGRMVLQARSQGQIPLIMAECTSELHLRGIARYQEEPTAENFEDLLHSGTLAITIEPPRGEPYQGIVPLERASLSACLEDYFARSEQLESRFFLIAGEQRCAGLLLQQLPSQLVTDPDIRDEEWSTVTQLAGTLTGEELLELESEEVLYRLFHQHQVKLFAPRKVQYRCSCSRERTARALHTIGEDEVMDILAEQGAVEIGCEFCGKQYRFEDDELRLLFESPTENKMH